MRKKSFSFSTLTGLVQGLTWSKRILFILLTVVTVLVLFLPLLTVTSGDSATSIWLLSKSFIGLALLMIVLLIAVWGWNFHHGMRQFIHVVFGFKDNDHLLNFGLLLTMTASLLGIGNTVGVTSIVTSSLSTTWGYSVVLIVLFVLLLYSLYLMLQEARLLNKAQFMNIIRRDKKTDDATESVQSLFGEEE